VKQGLLLAALAVEVVVFVALVVLLLYAPGKGAPLH
jgi:hypothetical protein